MTTRSCLLAAASLLAPFAVLAGTTADASAPPTTCRGVAATIVSTDTSVKGTDGPDVIVAVGVDVDALGGDDLLCVDGASFVRGGPGNDVVENTGSGRSSMSVFLEEGDDVFLGGVAEEMVHTGDGKDTVATGRGDDTVDSGAPDEVNDDVLETGPGDDIVVYAAASMGPAGALDGGPGSDLFVAAGSWRSGAPPFADHARVLIDNSRGESTVGGAPHARWTGMEEFDLSSASTNPLTFRGSGADEVLEVAETPADVDLGPGDDRLTSWQLLNGTFDGGRGRDVLEVQAKRRAIVDLSGSTRISEDGVTVKAATVGFDDAVLDQVDIAVVRGTDGSNVVRVAGTRVRVGLGGGADKVRMWNMRAKGVASSRVVYGGAGPDTLYGSRGDDVLLGGGGRDDVRGSQGVDRCEGELVRGCELLP
jgi:Ca2+-binding RTX toxin-like protein